MSLANPVHRRPADEAWSRSHRHQPGSTSPLMSPARPSGWRRTGRTAGLARPATLLSA